MGNTMSESQIRAKQPENLVLPGDSRQEHPLLNDLVLMQIFSLLDYKSLQQCRLVCQKWKYIAEPTIVKRSRIVIKSQCCKEADKSFKKKLRSATKEGSSHIRAFKFQGMIPLSAEKLEKYFGPWRNDSTELLIQNCTVSCLRAYDIKNLIGPHITRLEIRDNRFKYCSRDKRILTRFTVPLQILVSVEHILLENCNVIVSDTKISPKVAKFDSVNFFCDEKILEDILVNDVIDFRQLNDLTLLGNNIKLDMMNKVNLDSLTINKTPVNWMQSKWNVKTLILRGIPFLKISEMEIHELKAKHCQIDLSVLPRSLEYLTLIHNDRVFSTSTTLRLPNLKGLRYYSRESYSDLFPCLLSNCNNLLEVSLGTCSRLEKFDLNFLPQNVKILRLKGDVHEIIGKTDPDFHLDSLNLEHWTINSVNNNLRHFPTADNTVLTFGKFYFGRLNADVDIQKVVRLIRRSNRNIIVGSFCVYDEDFSRSALSNYVDKNAKYYRFNNGIGKAIV